MEAILIKALLGANGAGVLGFAIWIIYKLALRNKNGIPEQENVHTAVTQPNLPILGGTNPVDEISGVIRPDQQPITIGEHTNFCEKIQAKKEKLVMEQLKEIEKAVFMASKETSNEIASSARETNAKIEAVRTELKEVDEKVGATRIEVAGLKGKMERIR